MMLSKIFCFNKTQFRKNCTRFGALWIGYMVCLILGLALMYSQNGREFWYAPRLGDSIRLMAVVNMLFAAVAALCLFGDLYNSRMCNGLHALPLRREGIFFTNLSTGFCFSLVPTAVMAVLSLPLLMGTCVTGAWKIALLWFLATNLEFLCFFGIALLCVFLTGNHLAMGLIYTACNGLVTLCYLLVDSIYTPLLPGVVTPTAWAKRLTPIWALVKGSYVEVENYNLVKERAQLEGSPMVASWSVDGQNWKTLWIWAVVGLLLMAVALLLYRRRKLECAGDALVFGWMRSLFAAVAGVGGVAGLYVANEAFFGLGRDASFGTYLFLCVGLLLGWFAAYMLLERRLNVFRLRNIAGGSGLVAALILSLVLTNFDVLGIASWLPDPQKVAGVQISAYVSEESYVFRDPAVTQKVLAIHRDGIQTRLESENYHYTLDGTMVDWANEAEYQRLLEASPRIDMTHVINPFQYPMHVGIRYTLESGRVVEREYYLLPNTPSGKQLREITSDWEYFQHMGPENLGDLDVNRVVELQCDSVTIRRKNDVDGLLQPEKIRQLLDAMQQDAADGTMSPLGPLHHGNFKTVMPNGEISYYDSIYLCIVGENHVYASMNIYPDSENTVRWLQEHNLLSAEAVSYDLAYLSVERDAEAA